MVFSHFPFVHFRTSRLHFMIAPSNCNCAIRLWLCYWIVANEIWERSYNTPDSSSCWSSLLYLVEYSIYICHCSLDYSSVNPSPTSWLWSHPSQRLPSLDGSCPRLHHICPIPISKNRVSCLPMVWSYPLKESQHPPWHNSSYTTITFCCVTHSLRYNKNDTLHIP